MCYQDLWVFLEYGCDIDQWNILFDGVEFVYFVVYVEFDFVGDQKCVVGGIWVVLDDGDVQFVFFVGVIGNCLIIVVMFGLGELVGVEGDFVECVCWECCCEVKCGRSGDGFKSV